MTRHYKRKKDPAVVGDEAARRPGPVAVVWTLDTVKSRCEIDGDCWLWTGKVTDGRYPAAAINGVTRSVARWVLEQKLDRDLAKGKHAKLKCASDLCVSPQCVFEASLSKTIREALAGRAMPVRSSQTRERNRAHALSLGWGKLTPEKAAEIRAAKGVTPVAEVAERFGIAASTVYSIWQGARWREEAAPIAANGSSVFAWRPAA